MVTRAPTLQLERTRLRRALWLAAGCSLVLAGCGEDTESQATAAGGNAAVVDAAGDTGGSDAGVFGAGGAAAGEDGGAGEGQAAAAGTAGAARDGAAGAAADGSAGANGSAGASGGAGGGRPDGCLDLSHLEDTMRMRWDLRVIGTGFDADDGSRVRVVITFSGAPSYGLAETTVQGGSFDIVMPKAVEPYTGIGVYIDKGRDDACTLGVDGMWQRTTGGVSGDFLWQLTPDQKQPSGASPCIINGIFDLTVPLPCP